MVRVRVRGWEKHYANESPHKDRNQGVCVCVCKGHIKMVKYSSCGVCISSAVFLIVLGPRKKN